MITTTPKRDTALLMKRLLPLIDVVLIIASFRLAHWLRYDKQILRAVGEFNRASFDIFWPYIGVFAVWFLLSGSVSGLYRERRGRGWIEETYLILTAAANSGTVVMALSFLLQPLAFSRLMTIIATVLVILILALARLLYRFIRQNLRRRGIGTERVLMVGLGEVGRAVLSSIISRPDLGYVVVGYIDDDPERGDVDLGRVRGLGNIDNLDKLLTEHEVNLVILSLPWDARHKIMEIVQICEKYGVAARFVPDLFQLNLSQVQVENLEGIPLLGLKTESRMTRSKYLIKRTLDLLLITLSAPLVASVAAIVAVAIKLDSEGPIIYRQRRVGKDGREFWVYKFRSMIVNAEKLHHDLIRRTGADPRRPKWADDPRITRVGRILRKTSLDELPNLLNVLHGEMSLVGPRPPTPSEVALYEPWQRQRLNTQPGLTCLWQVSGRSKVPFEEQCLMDIYYIENWSLGLEIQILLRTIPNVLLGNGAY